MYSKFGIDEKVINLSKTSMEQIRPVFDEISKIVEHNTLKVISAMQEYQLSEMHFHGTTGYGYDDVGRDTIEKI